MIDIHTHILPNIDDGSSHEDITSYYLDRLNEAGIEGVVFTPHYYRGIFHNTKDKILLKYDKVLEMIKKKGYKFNTYCSAEVYLMGSEVMTDIQDNAFMINGSRYVLVENSLFGFSFDMYENLYKLSRLGFKPILAHPERYQELLTKPDLSEDFMYRDVYFQINTGSILGEYGNNVRDLALKLIDKGHAHFLGSDCHCTNGEYNYLKAVEYIRREFGDKTADILSYEHPLKMINNENIPHFYLKNKAKPVKKNLLQRLFRL